MMINTVEVGLPFFLDLILNNEIHFTGISKIRDSANLTIVKTWSITRLALDSERKFNAQMHVMKDNVYGESKITESYCAELSRVEFNLLFNYIKNRQL